jgi:hypothetical protein
LVFVPENALEVSLVKATNDRALRAPFYRALLESDLFVIRDGPSPEETGQWIVAPGEEVKVRSMDCDGETCVAAFSSRERLLQAITEPAGFLGLNARSLMEMTQGAGIALNPGSDYGKVFSRAEVAAILDGSLWRPDSEFRPEHDIEVLLGQPAIYPQELIDVLIDVLKRLRSVRRAYVARFFNPVTDEKPHTIIALDVVGDWDAIMAEVGVAIHGMEIPEPPVDFLQMMGSTDGAEGYFRNDCEPFYRRKRLGLF